jgi:hypothetical protein
VRQLSPEQFDKASVQMSQFKGQRAEVSVFPVTFEGNWIASAIYGMLISAK